MQLITMNKNIIFLYIISLSLLYSCQQGTKTEPIQASQNSTQSPIPEAIPLTYQIIGTLDHDTSAFTQGFVLDQGSLIEGTGLERHTRINKIDTSTAKVEVLKANYENEVFGEGITILNNKLYQLTYMNNKIYQFDLDNLKQPSGTHSWQKEGWGLTHDSTSLILSDGSSMLYYLNPENMAIIKELKVIDNMGSVDSLNELEYVEGYIFANQWGSDYIYKIDPETGYVVGKISFEGILQLYDKSFQPDPEKVLNGIAWDPMNKFMFVTGKNWPLIFKIRIN